MKNFPTRIINSALLASAALAAGSCTGPAKVSPDYAALQDVEEKISRVRPLTATTPTATPTTAPAPQAADVAAKSAAFASSIDAALQSPALAAKIDAAKTGDVSAIKTLEPKPDTKAVAKIEPKPEPKPEAKLAAKPDPKPQPQVVLASHAEPDTKIIVESKAGKTETKVVPAKTEPTKVEPAKVETTKPEPTKTEPTKVEPTKPDPAKLEPTKTADAAPTNTAVAVVDTSNKAITAMGSMTAAGVSATTDDAARAADTPAVEAIPMDTILAQLRRQVAANPRQLNVALALQLLSADSKTAGPDTSLSALSESDQKIVADVTAAVSTIMATPATAAVTERAAPLAAAASKWAAEADLSLPRLVLASRVDSYGVFTPVEPKFENGKRHTVIIYCEVANFATRKSDDGFFTTKLSQQDSLITEDGLLVWRPNPEEVEDRSRNQRRDFYLVKKLTIPDTLAIGKYTLRMSVTDKQTNKIAMLSIPVEITAR